MPGIMLGGVLTGTLIGESLRAGAQLRAEGLRVRRVYRLVRTDAAPGQPAVWTVIDFEAGDGLAGLLAENLAGALSAEGGWYADFRAGDDHVVVFAGKVFCYRRGDEAGRAAAVAYGLAAGVPRHQLDWPR